MEQRRVSPRTEVWNRSGKSSSRWIAADDNSWGVPLLDISHLSMGYVSLATSQRDAENAASFKGETGSCWEREMPRSLRTIRLNLRFRIDRTLVDGVLFNPMTMEQKWAIYVHGGDIILVRSWDRAVYLRARTWSDGKHLIVIDGLGFIVSPDETEAFTRSALDFIIRSHALDEDVPAPIPGGRGLLDLGLAEVEAEALWQYGDRARRLSVEPLELPMSSAVLRTESLLHIAIARSDLDLAQRLLDGGVHVDILDKAGRNLMCWATGSGTRVLEWLLARGHQVDARCSGGETALMLMVELRDVEKVRWLLERGADPDAVDGRGFGALHRAAELGLSPIVEALLHGGADRSLQAGPHTPMSLALRGRHHRVVQMLNEG